MLSWMRLLKLALLRRGTFVDAEQKGDNEEGNLYCTYVNGSETFVAN
jgi:hypothetical protein